MVTRRDIARPIRRWPLDTRRKMCRSQGVRPRLLDLFCGAGGSAAGYHRAGFDVIGIDINPQPHYPFEFHQADALEVLEGWEIPYEVDAIHASPPCQAYSTATANHSRHPDLYDATRAMLTTTDLPWVIENVIGSPYRSGIVLCGSMFGLGIQRHRNFESSHLMMQPHHDHRDFSERPYTVTGHLSRTEQNYPHSRKPAREHALELMDVPWMTWEECVLAIPPAYTEWIGAQLLEHLKAVA